MAGTNWYVYSPGTTVNAVELNANFDWIEDHIAPMNAGSKTSGAYDLGFDGATSYPFKGLYLDNSSTDGGAVYFNNGTTKYIKSSADGSDINFSPLIARIIETNGVNLQINQYSDSSWDIGCNKFYDWRFNSGTATTYDGVGINDLTANSAPTFIAGKLNNCTNLDGIDDCWYHADDATLEVGTESFTICCWLYAETISSNRRIFNKCGTGDVNNRFDAYIDNADGKVYIGMGTTAWTASGSTFPLNEWVFFWVRRSSGTITCGWTTAASGTFNTTNQISFTDNNSLGSNVTRFTIGALSDNSNSFDGKIDEFKFFTKYALSNTELSDLYNNGNGTEYQRDLGVSIPSAESDINKMFTTQFNYIFSQETSGTQQINGNICIGGVYGDAFASAFAADNINACKYTCLFDKTVTHIITKIYTPVAGGKTKFAIYDHNDAGYPSSLLVQSKEYVMKGDTITGDRDAVVMVPLESSLSLKGGTKYWIAENSDSGYSMFGLASAVRTTQGQSWSHTYTSTNAFTATIASTGSALEFKAMGAI